MVLTLRLRV